jgi:hypothetical protein
LAAGAKQGPDLYPDGKPVGSLFLSSVVPAFLKSSSAARIILLCNSYPPETGAAPGRMQSMAHALHHAGYEVLVICGRANYPTGRVFPEQRSHSGVVETIQEGIRVVRLPFLPSRSPRRYVRMGSLATLALSVLWHGPKIIRAFAPDVLLVSSPPLPLATAGAKLARRQGIPLVLNVSDLWPLTARELGALGPGAMYKFLERKERALFQQAAGWLGQSEEILGYLKRHAGEEKPHFLYRNLPPILLKQAVGNGAQAPAPTVPQSHIKVVYAGLLGPVQGILEIVKAIDFQKLGFTLDLYGDGICKEALLHFTNAHPERGVRLCGLVPAAQMHALMPQYNLALASLSRPIFGAVPSKLFAAIGAGLPLLFCGGGEGEKLVQKHNLGWTAPPGDMAVLKGMLENIKRLPAAEWLQKQIACQQAAKGVFNSTTQKGAFLEFIGSFVKSTSEKL